ncbi:MAG: hypothetical protein ABII01_07470 [Candidatus Woesearchaeota archaeon]
MWEFIKKLFKKEEDNPIEISESNIINWFDEKIAELSKDLDENLKSMKLNIYEEIKTTQKNLEILGNASLRNPDISMKEKHMMHGNRQAYLRKIDVFLNQINVNENNYSKLLNFCDFFETNLIELGKSTARQYMVLQHFFGNESRDVAINLKNLENHIKRLKNMIKESQYFKILEIKDDIAAYFKKKALKFSIGEDVSSSASKINKLTEEKDRINKEIRKLEASEDYRQIQSLEKKYQEIEEKINIEQNKFIHLFSGIETALKKYSRVTLHDTKLIDNYLDKPVIALSSDSSFQILSIFDDLSKAVLENKLDLKDKKREKTISALNSLDDVFLRKYANNMKELVAQKDKIHADLTLNEVNNRIEILRAKIIDIETNILASRKQKDSFSNEWDKIDLIILKKDIEDKIKDKLGLMIRIS